MRDQATSFRSAQLSGNPGSPPTPRRRFGRGSLAAFGAAAALVGALGLAGDAPARTSGEPVLVHTVASQTAAVPADHTPPVYRTAVRAIEKGEASYYHDSLAGNPTASGTPYRPAALTAAHRTLPLGSKVRVTDLDSGRSVVVEVNDRGPFAKGRIIDLSRAAARQLGMIQRGHTDVRLEIVGS